MNLIYKQKNIINISILTLVLAWSVASLPTATLAQVMPQCALSEAFSNVRLPLFEGEHGYAAPRVAGPVGSAAPQTVQKLRALLAHSAALRNSAEWRQVIGHRLILDRESQQEAASGRSCLRIMLTTGPVPAVELLLRAPSGVSERYSVGEHSGRVYETYLERQRGLRRPSVDGIAPADQSFFETLTLLHDIGKGFSGLLRRSDLEVEFSQPLAYRMFLLMGFSEDQARLGRELIHYHKLLGNVAQGFLNLTRAQNMLEEGARSAGVEPRRFYLLLENLFIADAASYPGVHDRSFEMLEGGLFPSRATEPNFYVFRTSVLDPQADAGSLTLAPSVRTTPNGGPNLDDDADGDDRNDRNDDAPNGAVTPSPTPHPVQAPAAPAPAPVVPHVPQSGPGRTSASAAPLNWRQRASAQVESMRRQVSEGLHGFWSRLHW